VNYKPIVTVVVPYVMVNIYSYSGLIVTVTNNLIGLIFSRIAVETSYML